MKFTIELERKDDGHWLAESIELPGLLGYGSTPDDAIVYAKVLAQRVAAERIEHDEKSAMMTEIIFS